MYSFEIARDPFVKPVWDPKVRFPTVEEMPDLDVVTHVSVEKAIKGGYHFLLTATVAYHNGRFFMGWANNAECENDADCIVRGKTSRDGIHWSEAETWMTAPLEGVTSFNHPLLFAEGGRLYAYVASWYGDKQNPYMHVFTYNDETEKWDIHPECRVTGFIPFCAPQKMDDGNWIMSGEKFWFDAAVLISHGDDLTKWDMVTVPKQEGFKFYFPESSIITKDDRLILFCRSHNSTTVASISESFDNGRTWTPFEHSNFPMTDSMPFAGTLSTGQNYILTNNLDEGRSLLTIALTDKDRGLFKRIYKVRHQMWPARRVFGGYLDGMGSHAGKPTEWSYPKAMEHEGKLYVAYSQGKEDCSMSIIPIEVLQ